MTRLALLNASARPASEEQLAAWEQLRRRVAAGDFGALAADFAAANLPARRRGDAALVARVEAMARAVGPRALLRQLDAQAGRPDNRAWLGRIGVPALVLSGAEDEVCPPPLQDELAAGIPGAVHATVADAGHMAALEQPAAVAGHMLEWLAR